MQINKYKGKHLKDNREDAKKNERMYCEFITKDFFVMSIYCK